MLGVLPFFKMFQPYIDAYEGALGVRSVDTIWELTDEIDLTTLS